MVWVKTASARICFALSDFALEDAWSLQRVITTFSSVRCQKCCFRAERGLSAFFHLRCGICKVSNSCKGELQKKTKI